MTTVTSFVAIAIVLAVATPARAQTAEAETLFREGKRLMKKGDIAEACKQFDASERLDPGIGTELNLGNCLERNHQTASAWAMFVKATASAKRVSDGKREAEARRRAAALEKQLVYLTIVVPDDHRVPGLQITRNDTAVGDALWGQRTPVDPDDYTITARADGYAPWTTGVSVKSRSRRVEVPALEPRAGKPDVEPTVPARAPVAAAPPAPAAPPPAPPATHWRKPPLALAVVGVVGVGAGITLGLLSRNDESSSDATCPTTACSDSQALDLNSRARTEALGADVAFAVGGAALASAVVWWLVAGTSTTEHLAVMPSFDHVGIVAAGRF